MDASTERFYATSAAACAPRYDDACVDSLHEILRSLASNGSRALEIGGGSGRDAAFMVERGYDVTYTDGCREMVDQAVRLHPELSERARVAAFPLSEDDELLKKRFDLVLCVGVIMHLKDACLERFASQVAPILPADGHLVLSHSSGHRDIVDNRDASGRLFHERPVGVVDRVFEPRGLQVKRQVEDSDGMGRQSIRWITEVLRKTA